MAGSTGLEPAASGVTGRRSNQLNYDPELVSRAGPYEGLDAVPKKSIIAIRDWRAQTAFARIHERRLGGTGLEPVTAGV